MSWGAGYALSPDQPEMQVAHHFIYESGIIGRGYWMGHPIGKHPCDLLMYAEVLHRTRPTVLIETGTNAGGSALWFAHCFDNIAQRESGTVHTLDPFPRDDGRERPQHGRIQYHPASSVDADYAMRLRGCLDDKDRIMVVLDAVHAAGFVACELELWAPLVTPGCYLVVEDTNLNGHPVVPDHGPGPAEALAAFLATDLGRCFEVDRHCERYGISMSPGGWCKRVR